MEDIKVNKKKESNKNEQDYEYNNLVDRVARWDKYRIDQMSITNNLIFTLCLAFLGFLVKQDYEIPICNCWFFSIKLLSILFLIVSLITGAWTSYNRLIDFRTTSKLTKKEKLLYEAENMLKKNKDINEISLDIKYLKEETRKLGKHTWVLLQFQLWSFTLGSILGLILIML